MNNDTPSENPASAGTASEGLRKPEWLKIRLRSGGDLTAVNGILTRHSLNTVCKEANCPNRMECYSKRTATFMILGAVCSRNCAFCNVTPGTPEAVDPDEPRRILQAVRELGLKYVVITSVTRDDLGDGGSDHFVKVIRVLKEALPDLLVEVLIPDFQGGEPSLRRVVEAGPDVLNHNVETIPRLYPLVRPQAVYTRSLELLSRAKTMDASMKTKSGLMVGLGETPKEVTAVLKDLRKAACDYLTIGQYLAPSKEHYPVAEYVHPDIFAEYRRTALELGFTGVAASPFVRSSYKAAEMAGGA